MRADGAAQGPGGDQVLQAVHLLLPVAAFRPVAQKLSAQTGTGGCEVISGQPQQFAAVAFARLQCRDQIKTLVDLVFAEAHHLIAWLQILTFDQAQGFFGARTEFGAHPQAWRHHVEQGNRLICGEIVEAERHKAVAVPPAIGSQQMQFATQAVSEAQR